MKVVATRIDVWNDKGRMDGHPDSHATVKSNWQALCASASPHQLRYPNEGPIDVVCDAKVNSYIENVFSALLKPAAITSDVPTTSRRIPTFYVVRPFEARHNYDFEAVDGSEAFCGPAGGNCTYRHPHAHSTVRVIVSAPVGGVLIPDTALALLTNEAQCAALLSYSLVGTDQGLIERLFRVQQFKGKIWTLSYKTSGRQNNDRIWGFVWLLNEQRLRLGIRQMYLAGYDIREAPFAWSVEQGKQIKGPVDEPNEHMPWYATYAFNVISQLYPNADYSKLKRGKKEYQQFLEELRKADPEAFEHQKPQSAQQHN